MSLVSMNEILNKAKDSDYAVPGFNFYTYEEAFQIVRAANDLKSPVILMATGSCVDHLGLDLIVQIAKKLAIEFNNIPVAIHLDHASDQNTIYKAMKAGFTSVMFDGSLLPVEENIKKTKEVVKIGNALGVSVEAEIGRVGKGEEGKDIGEVLTAPKAAKSFYEKTNVDALAVAIGTVHGMQKQEAKLRFDLAERISELVDVPLVLHGSSGVKDEEMKQIIKTKFSKINIGTRLKKAYADGIKDYIKDHPNEKGALNIIKKGSQELYKVVKEKIKLVNSHNKA
ncbi:MAG: class II fructose-bisphosphate aldolase [Thermotogota bacterium]|nr:class II fructose-bisphosphate aldolase [Thermotogota bacterium]